MTVLAKEETQIISPDSQKDTKVLPQCLQERLVGKNVFVTGGTSGVGESLVQLASNAGAHVLFTYRTQPVKAREMQKHLRNIIPLNLTLGDPGSTNNLLEDLSFKGYGVKGDKKLNYMILNAGFQRSATLEDHTPEMIDEMIRARVLGNMYLVRDLIKNEFLAENSDIAIIGSIAADGNDGQFAYSIANAALRGFAGWAARDQSVRKKDITIKVLELAWVDTPMTQRRLAIMKRKLSEKYQKACDFHYIMTANYTAEEILDRTTSHRTEGVMSIPDGATLEKVISVLG